MKISRLAFSALAVAGILALLWLVGGNVYARHREKQVERDWVQSFGTRKALLDRYPRTVTNETARHLESLVKPLGIDLTPKTRDEITAQALASSKSQLPEDRARRAVFLYLTAELERPEAAIDPPPQEVREFFSTHAKDLRNLDDELVASPPPTWNFDPSSQPDRQVIPNYYALLRLQRTLLAEALVQSFDEVAGAASRTLEASWRLNQTLREVPDISCQLIALAVARSQGGALRKVDVDASPWQPRLTEHNFKQSVFDMELLALWPDSKKYRRLEEDELRSEGNLLKRLVILFRRPYDDFVSARVKEGMRLGYLQVRDSPLSDQAVREWKVGPKSTSAEVILSIQMPNLLNAFRRVDSFVLEAELTAKILEARQLRHQNGLQWPPSIPGIEMTQLPGASWIYSVSPRGMMSIYLSRDPNWGFVGHVLPLCFTSS